MSYNMHVEPGHAELFAEVRHVDLGEYQPGQPHYEQLMERLAMNQRFEWPSSWETNV